MVVEQSCSVFTSFVSVPWDGDHSYGASPGFRDGVFPVYSPHHQESGLDLAENMPLPYPDSGYHRAKSSITIPKLPSFTGTLRLQVPS